MSKYSRIQTEILARFNERITKKILARLPCWFEDFQDLSISQIFFHNFFQELFSRKVQVPRRSWADAVQPQFTSAKFLRRSDQCLQIALLRLPLLFVHLQVHLQNWFGNSSKLGCSVNHSLISDISQLSSFNCTFLKKLWKKVLISLFCTLYRKDVFVQWMQWM